MNTSCLSFTLRALAHLLRYPDAAMRLHLPDILPVLQQQTLFSTDRKQQLRQLCQRLQSETLDAEAAYVELFDRGRGTALHLFEHVHGDSRDRGPAMIDLIQTYEQAGLLLDPDELPDHLTVLLEFASTQPSEQARSFIGEFAHILQTLHATLLRRHSDYAVVLAAILEAAGQSAALSKAAPDEESLDDSWQEPVAFDGCGSNTHQVPSPATDSQPLRFVDGTHTR
ncbi:MAG: nitrate reductase molybdenum cofactor assembly chaperone [Pseudomonadales bacterium]|nr:nitrate reductase molybdenum cofactor assembly chaperone [Pseudomonadales bacterium]